MYGVLSKVLRFDRFAVANAGAPATGGRGLLVIITRKPTTPRLELLCQSTYSSILLCIFSLS